MKKNPENSKVRRFGFSLIELMVVVVIIAVLAAIAMPIYGKYIRKSRTSEAISNLGTIAMFEETYFSEADSYIKLDPNPGTVPRSSDTGGRRSFDGTNASWALLGRVIPDQTPLYFQYEARAGQMSTTAGTANTGTYLVAHTDSQTVGTNKACTPTPATLTAVGLQIPTPTSSNWYYVTAVGDLKTTGSNNKCSVFIKIIDRPDVVFYNDIE
ncbi:MAG: prepilin-type N-terminal cleavage/methylation domain-containing protein [Pseudomonadota bacterium]